jgi:hypothetical protein
MEESIMSPQRRFTPLEAKLLKLKERRTDLDRIIRMLAQYRRKYLGAATFFH